MASLQMTIVRLVALVLQLATASHTALLSQKAVFGSSFSDIYRPLIVPFVFAVSMARFLRQRKGSRSARRIHAATVVYSTAIPFVARSVGEYTGMLLGPWLGAFVMDCVCFYPILIGAGSMAARIFHSSTSKAAKSALGEAGASGLRMVLIALFTTRLFMICEGRIIGRLYVPLLVAVLPRGYMAFKQAVVINTAATAVLALLSPPRKFTLPLVACAIALQISYFGAQTNFGNTDLSAIDNGGIVASTISTTGYISVVSKPEKGYLALRNDHSLLGGDYIKPPPSVAIPKGAVWTREPIYSSFAMQEAVRLVTPAPVGVEQDGKQVNNALVIGLGIGTCAKALVSHGIATDVVELDTAVLQYAVDYFEFPINQSRVTICDGRYFAHSLAQTLKYSPEAAAEEGLRTYDYVVHDVFTGGVVSPTLFTTETWEDIRGIMSPDGVLVVNLGGDFATTFTRTMLRTLVQGFRDSGGKCRAFREDAPPDSSSSSSSSDDGAQDFTNAVVFCRRARGGAIGFRQPTEEDYLGSIVRHQSLVLKHEIELPVYLRDSEEALDLRGEAGWRTIADDSTNRVSMQAADGAARHWWLMNGVLGWRGWALW
ncbi:S-adenosyl-L-methionine-dependent methyltransferase [Myxozyma melibiosi]|uniref:S-adenosyl-L-methionine-dependent methyltransferase n=1 Tax=Myxozyma melibiosi TaxID=54550 RepID=A0ABR1FCL5_9ASCO